MIARKYPVLDKAMRLGCSGDEICLRPEYLNYLFFTALPDEIPPASFPPALFKRRCRVAIIASGRVYRGFAWQNACYELAPENWRDLLRLARPDYLLVESCLYDSARAWPLDCFKPDHARRIREIAQFAAKLGIFSVFWFTLGCELLPRFMEGMRAFDFVGCADFRALEKLRASGIPARYFPWSFAPEKFNPLKTIGAPPVKPRLLFDGIARSLRFENVRSYLEKLPISDLTIIDSGMLTPEYNISRSVPEKLRGFIRGCVSRAFIQDWYKSSTALLSLVDGDGAIAPAMQCRALEAAACHLPVLHLGTENVGFLKNFSEIFADASVLRERYLSVRDNFIEREIAGHLAWRKAHASFTFAHRMDEIERRLGKPASSHPRASVISPSMRPQNFEYVVAQFLAQDYENRELVYVYNGPAKDSPKSQNNVARILHVPEEYTTGMAMNAGFRAATGHFFFRFDDDDLYGPAYISDRMIYFAEFPIDVLCNARFFINFADSGEAFLMGPQEGDEDNTVFPMGHASYAMYKYSGGSVAMRRAFALGVGFQEQAYAHTDVSLLMKGVRFARNANFLKVDCLNFCVRRGDVRSHTWSASRDEIMEAGSAGSVPLQSIFV